METTNQPAVQQDKTVAILAYCTLIGYIIAIVLHGNNKTKLGSYHLRQATGLLIIGIGYWVVNFILIMILPFLGFLFAIISPFVGLGVLVLLILGIMNAANGQEKPVPLVGPFAEKMLGNAFA
jgi:uncharacterized membrane protein